MRNLYLILLLLYYPILIQSQIKWFDCYDTAMEVAQEENKLIVVNFWAHWCKPCIQMDKIVWEDLKISKLNKKFIFVKLDVSSGVSDSRFSVSAIPNVLITDSYGSIMSSFIGSENANYIKTTLNQFPSDVSKLNKCLELYFIEKQDANRNYELALAYQSVVPDVKGVGQECFVKYSNKYLKRAKRFAKRLDDSVLLEKINCVRLLNYYHSGKFKKCVNNFEKIYPIHYESKKMKFLGLVKSYTKLNLMDKALNAYNVLQEMLPEKSVLESLIDDGEVLGLIEE